MRVERVSTAEGRALLAAKKPRHKYHAKPTTLDGHRFDSQKEADRWGELGYLVRAEKIANLQHHVVFELHAPTMNADGEVIGLAVIARYEADFVYQERGRVVVEDTKGVRTAMYRLKRRWMAVEYGTVIRET